MTNWKIKKLPHLLRTNSLVLLGIGLGILYWVFDSILMTLSSSEIDLVVHLFAPGVQVIGRRILVIVLLLAFGTYTNFVINKRKRAREEIKQRNVELAALNAVAATVSQSLELNTTINNALDEVLRLDMLAGEAHGMAFLLDEKTSDLSLAAHRGAPQDHPCLAHPPQEGECLCGLAIHLGEIVISEDSYADDRHVRKWPDMPHHKDICIPLKVRGEVLGVLNIRLPITQVITPDVIELLTAVADQISVAIKNARLFEAVDLQREQLRVLGARLSEVEEAERRRLARELHDQVGQNLTALGINLNVIKTQIPDEVASDVETFLDESLGLVEQTTERIRDVMADLRPPMLDDYGLMATLRWFGDQFASRVGLPVTVRGEELIPRLAEPLENALFRIATEALTNVAKHAQASEATVELSVEGETLRLVILDDGIGFNPELLGTGEMDRGWGLLTMAERTEALGGRFWVESQPSHEGTRVIVEIVR